MKKIFGLVFSLFLMFAPVSNVFASELEEINLADYETANLKETLDSEKIKLSGDYKESDSQVTIYMFRGLNCGFCKSFLNFLNSIVDEYGKNFKLVSFEAWYDENNSNLLSTISSFLGSEAKGVPYIIIGDEVFPGYDTQYDDSIKNAIKTQYEADEKYDVFEAYNEYVRTENKKASKSTTTIIIWNFVFIAISTCLIMMHTTISNNKVLRAMGYVKEEKEVEEVQIETKKEVKKESKKDTLEELKEVKPERSKLKTSKKSKK